MSERHAREYAEKLNKYHWPLAGAHLLDFIKELEREEDAPADPKKITREELMNRIWKDRQHIQCVDIMTVIDFLAKEGYLVGVE